VDRLPDDWWKRFKRQVANRGLTLKEFCATPPTISEKTLRRANAKDEKNEKRISPYSLHLLAQKLGFHSEENLLAEWREEHDPAHPPSKLDAVESDAADDRFVALDRNGMYDDAVELAKVTLARAEYAGDAGLSAHWADRVADAHRAIGSLREASAHYARAWGHVQSALASAPHDFGLRLQEARTRFGRIMVDDYLMHGAARDALSHYDTLLQDAEELITASPEHLHGRMRVRLLHIRRQQAEMLRMMGRYTEALETIRTVADEYPEAEYEPHAWARLCEAGALRLLGDIDAAMGIYERVEQFARDRPLPGLLGSTLVRKASGLKMLDKRAESEQCCREASQIASQYPNRYWFMTIYTCLVQASGRAADTRRALEQLARAEAFAPLTEDYLVMEFAHASLCRAELMRSFEQSDALRSFRTALSLYTRMHCAWGIVRAWIGTRLSGGAELALPPVDRQSLEGTDRQMLERFDAGDDFERGSLSVNIP
jgi:tetratricopeptide (TPR) repeat protein